MGAIEKESEYELQIADQKRKASLFAAIMLTIGLFSPVLISAIRYTTMPEVFIQGLFWYYSQGSGWYENGFSIFPYYMMISAVPFLLLRLVPVFQIYRYYNGNTTRKRVIIASFIGDGYFLFSAIVIAFLSFGYDAFHIPLTFQIIFSIIVLVKYRISEPTTPWISEEEPKSW